MSEREGEREGRVSERGEGEGGGRVSEREEGG